MAIRTFAIGFLLSLNVAMCSPIEERGQGVLAQAALKEILTRGAPILGTDTGCSKKSKTCDWMSKVPDSTKLVHMNIPGTHDTATWNYTQATQDSLLRYTGPIYPASVFQCQNQSILQSLNDGIRVFDLRYAYNPGNDTIGFHHSQALLAPQTRLEDVFFGFYSWLDKHPTEALLISMKYEGGTGTPNDFALQARLYDIFESELAKKYWVQANGTLGTLGEARGKMTLLQRFTYTLLPDEPAYSHRIGIHLDEAHWTDNSPSIELTYNTERNQTAYIEDYYEMQVPADAGIDANVQDKFGALTTHLTNATTQNPDQLYISFASAEHNLADPTVSPQIMALGDGTIPGVNQLLLRWLKAQKKGRLGVIMLDFYGAVPGLVEAIINH